MAMGSSTGGMAIRPMRPGGHIGFNGDYFPDGNSVVTVRSLMGQDRYKVIAMIQGLAM